MSDPSSVASSALSETGSEIDRTEASSFGILRILLMFFVIDGAGVLRNGESRSDRTDSESATDTSKSTGPVFDLRTVVGAAIGSSLAVLDFLLVMEWSCWIGCAGDARWGGESRNGESKSDRADAESATESSKSTGARSGLAFA